MIDRFQKTLLGILILAVFWAGPAVAFDVNEIATLMGKQANTSVLEVEDDTIFVMSAGVVIAIGVNGNDEDISYLAYLDGISGENVGHGFLNRFNQRVKFGRAYVDNDGDVAIQMDRNAGGGITRRNIESDIDVFVKLVWQFKRDMQRYTGA